MTRNTPETMDLIWGAEEIAKFIGRSQRAVFHMLDNGELPAKKVGGRWVAERSQLIRFFMESAA
ncbi:MULTISPECIES: helix-turn-helix domain-containing protein [unclassified Sinorhizobium]|uniref:helix-turn-helix domain-containing protein n=1 Tax=unclassified Sinorhizobium TaxID=2613772 RepID=UPI0024C21E2E|nr:MULTISPECIES: helix-turn-helix domain-containing protein [unclassified Sinorhizobium]MDK1377120.1 helix-turn-helix domain-containing protein [Sinorhizobium sp. 6-70]MDK1479585.1 helix-turn-helix domain-containing protein [Sinorhizobium sp. 6-117]